MRSRNDLHRLAAAAPAALAQTDSLVDADEEDRILERILATGRASRSRRPRLVLLLAGVAVLAAAAAVGSLEFGHSNPAAPQTSGHHHLALSGAKIELAGYHFRTPAGYVPSAGCPQPATAQTGGPNTVVHTMQSAASADGGCLQVALIAGTWTVPSDAQPVSVGSYNGFLVAPANIPRETLFVQIPAAQGDHYLVVAGQGLNVAQLVAIALSGLPSAPGTTTTCAENCG
jgi:hypothetical protein